MDAPITTRSASCRLGMALLSSTLLLTMGCATHRYDPYGNPYDEPHGHTHATEGAILGGLAGAGVGRMIAGHHHDEVGYLIGGALGALTGAAIGDALDREHSRDARPVPYPHPDVPLPSEDPDDRYYDEYDDGRFDEYDDADDYGREPPPAPRPSILNVPDEVLFAEGSDRLTPGAKQRLRSVATALRRHRGTVAVVRGHASRSEPQRSRLSEARARAVRGYLLEQGLAPSRVTALGMGARFPVASDRKPEGRQRNQRVEIEIHTDRGRELVGLW